MPLMKSLFNTFILAIAALAVVSCVPKATEKKAICGANEAFDSVSRSCYSIEVARRVPVGTLSSASMSEETPLTVTLSYTDANSDQAKTCAVSGLSSNILAVSPWILNGGLIINSNQLYQAALTLANAIPAGAYTVTANNAKAAMQVAYLAAQNSYSNTTINTQMVNFKNQVNIILGLAIYYPANTTVQNYYTVAQQKLTLFQPVLSEVQNSCACTGGVCTTTIVPKLNKNGSAGFSYTVTDVDGTSAAKAVSLNIVAMSASAAHLKPVAGSVYKAPVGNDSDESITSVAASYAITLGTSDDLAGTASGSMRYYFNGSKNGSNQGITSVGLVQDCMDLVGSTGLTDRTCTYTPNDGDAFDVTAPAKAFVSVGTDLVFRAVSEGTVGNGFSVQYFDITQDNTSVDTYVTKTEKFGLIDQTSESFIRVVGNAIKIFINPGVTTSSQILSLVNSHPQAKHLVLVTGGSSLTYPQPSIDTPTPVFLAGGTNGFDTIPYYVNNLLTSSTNSASAMMRIVSKDDIPMVPKTYNSLFSQTETFLEAETRSISLVYKDVDSTVGFTFEAIVDATTPTCSTIMTNAAFPFLTPHANITVGAIPAPVCVSGTCTATVPITAVGDFAGNACLYYRVADSSGGQSVAVQEVNISVTNINDTPQISKAILPTITALGAASVNEDLAAGLNSYFDIYAGPGGGVWEASQLLTMTATSSNTALIPNTACKNYIPVASTPVGSIIPTAVGVYYFDTTNLKCYVSTGTTLATDWKLYPSLTVYPLCAYNKYGQGSPIGIVTPTAAGTFYIDTTNNICYKAGTTSSSSWAQDATISNYKLVYVPMADKSGTTNITVTVKDNGGTANSAVDTVSDVLALTVVAVDDPPVFLSTITSVETNEGGAVQSNAFQVDEDAGSTDDENAQRIKLLTITSDNASVLPIEAIRVFYDLNDNGVEDAGEARCVSNVAGCATPDFFLDTNAPTDDVKAHKFYLKLDPVDGVSGNANIALTITDGTTPITTNFSFIVHPVAALHGGWNNISSVGIKTDKSGAPVATAEIQCNYNKLVDTQKCSAGTAACTGTTSPNSTIVPDAANVIYWDSAAMKCYRSTDVTAYSWVEMNTSCPISRTVGSCADNNCITSSSPVGVTVPAFVQQYILDSSTNTCYVSKGTTIADWITYVPSKVTLAWKPFIMVGSGSDSAVQIAGWNVYRRESGADYNFKGGHLKNSTSTSTFTIADPTVRTFTDTTAIAGKVYYYVVRPVDTIRNFPTFTPESFSEVRVLAPPANYSFVHRWMVNQEICNGMNITNSTTPYAIDQTQNFRCPYKGPGESTVAPGYYDFGKDLLVDTQEVGCPYAAAPRCSANGCVGIGADFTSFTYPGGANALTANDLYYDRSSGTCYKYSGAGTAWSAIETLTTVNATISQLLRSALNAPLVNISQPTAKNICSTRAAPAGTDLAFSGGGAILPTKKDYMAYSAQKLNITDPEVTELEQGFSLNIQSRCNGSAASGLETAFTDSGIPSTSFIYSLPGTYSSNIRSLYTGSIPWGSSKGTDACVSRFGIQDLYGNVAEWVDDGVTCDPGTSKVCAAKKSGSFSTTGADFGTAIPYAFDNEIGPFAEGGDGIVGFSELRVAAGAADVTISLGTISGFPTAGTVIIESEAMTYTGIAGNTLTGLTRGAVATVAAAHAVGARVTLFSGSSDDSYLTQWTFADELFGAGNFNYPLGLPLTDNIDHTALSSYMDWVLAIGPSNGITTNKLHEDGIIVNASQSASKAFAVGGSYLSGNRAGRFSSELIGDTVANRPDVGFRCVIPINPAKVSGGGDYPADANYTYPP